MPKIKLKKPSSKCGGKSIPKISTMQGDDVAKSNVGLPKISLPVVKSDVELPYQFHYHLLNEVERTIGEKIKSSTMQSDDMADEYGIRFPKEGERITIVYEVHGGMAFNRPFDTDDTMLEYSMEDTLTNYGDVHLRGSEVRIGSPNK